MDPVAQKKLEDLEKQAADLAAIAKAKANSPAAPVPPIVAAATAPTDSGSVSAGAPAYETSDPLKGKGLAFITAARIASQSKGSYELAKEMASDKRIPYGEKVKDVLHSLFVTKAIGESTVTGGGALVPDPLSSDFVEVLRPNVVFMAAPGVLRVPISGSNSLTFARQSAAATGGWFGESQAMTASAPTFDNIQLSLKKFGCLTAIANDLLRDSPIAADMIVRNDLIAIAQRALDLACIRGAGTTYSPKGLLNLVAAGNLFNSAAAGTATLSAALSDLWKAIQNLRTANVPFNGTNAFWIMHPRTEAGLAQLRDGVGRPYFAQEMATGRLLGYQYFTTSQIPINLSGHGSGGSVESEIHFVAGGQCFLGEGLAPTIQIVPQGAYYDGSTVQSGLSRDETAVSVVLRADFAMRHTLGASIVQGTVY